MMEINPLARPSYEEILERIKTRYMLIFKFDIHTNILKCEWSH